MWQKSEAITYSVPVATDPAVLRRALDFTPSITLRKAIERRIRKLEKVK